MGFIMGFSMGVLLGIMYRDTEGDSVCGDYGWGFCRGFEGVLKWGF